MIVLMMHFFIVKNYYYRDVLQRELYVQKTSGPSLICCLADSNNIMLLLDREYMIQFICQKI